MCACMCLAGYSVKWETCEKTKNNEKRKKLFRKPTRFHSGRQILDFIIIW